ncbi:cupin domain-containing protein [Mycobacterium sp. SMC-4]|uniref:cupin domain-containing protein n=1 Tax=Mycobacterium sp. SMC-4 TaxID=2857059 RepID=UPI003D0863AB
MTTLLASASDVNLDLVDYDSGNGIPTVKVGIQDIETVNSTTVGVWEVHPGVLVGTPDTEEVFIVLSGDATITSEGDAEPIVVGPGSIVRLVVGQETRWDVRETVRKFWVHA